MTQKPTCALIDCDKLVRSHGYCASHAYRFKRYGNPLAGRKGSSHNEPLNWLHVHASHQDGNCLIWPFERSRHGYGVIKTDGKRHLASRLMCEFAHGLAPNDQLRTAHTCGNAKSGCVNPMHICWKTRRQNLVDTKRKGTWNLGKKHGNFKLSAAEILEIRALKGFVTQKEIAAKYGVNQSRISRILNDKEWVWVAS